MNKRTFSWILFACILTGITACRNKNREIARQIYYDYRIEGNEENDQVTCRFQYRLGGPNGTTLVMTPPGKVELDGQELKVDSAGFTGAFYELIRPVEEFSGHHTIAFTFPDEDPVREEFNFTPFRLTQEPPDVITDSLNLELTDFPVEQTPVHLVITDTAFQTTDVNQTVQVKNARLIVTKEMLSNLKTGPVTLEITKEEIKTLKNGNKPSGRMLISYGIKRDLNLASL